MIETTNLSLAFNEAKPMPEFINSDGDGRIKISYKNREDAKILVIVKNSGSESQLTVFAGDSIQGVGDLNVHLPEETTVAVVLESGRFMQTTGDDSGYVILYTGDSATSVAVVELP